MDCSVTKAIDGGISCWFADLPTAEFDAGTEIVFTFCWVDKWEGRDFKIITKN
jgi:hypothetical protein